MIERSFQPLRNSSSPSRRCRMTLVPRSARSIVSTSKSPAPSELQRTPCCGRQPGAARLDRDPVGDDEPRVEADAELADQLRVLLLVALQRRDELARAALGDRAEVGDRLFRRQADAVVADGDRLRVLVEGDLHRELGLPFVQLGLVDGLEAQLVAGVGGVRDQLAQEDLLVRVERVGDEVQDLLDLGLERKGLLVHRRFRQVSSKGVARGGARGGASADGGAAGLSRPAPRIGAPRGRGPPVRTVRATRYVTPLREGGSLPAIVEGDDDGLYVLKFRGAGQGPRALIAELVAGELARAVGPAGARDRVRAARRRPRADRARRRDPGPDPRQRRPRRRQRRPQPRARLPARLGRLRSARHAARRRPRLAHRLVRRLRHQHRPHARATPTCWSGTASSG